MTTEHCVGEVAGTGVLCERIASTCNPLAMDIATGVIA
jgi:hypothetical protein